MTTDQLLDNLQQDLGNINASRQAHQQVLQILQSYRQQLEKKKQEEAADEE